MDVSDMEHWWTSQKTVDNQVIKTKLREIAVGLQHVEDLMHQNRLALDLGVDSDFQGVLRKVNRLENLSLNCRRRRNSAKLN